MKIVTPPIKADVGARCVEKALEMFDEGLSDSPGKRKEFLDVHREAIYIWLTTTYDFDLGTIHREIRGNRGADENFRQLLSVVGARAHQW